MRFSLCPNRIEIFNKIHWKYCHVQLRRPTTNFALNLWPFKVPSNIWKRNEMAEMIQVVFASHYEIRKYKHYMALQKSTPKTHHFPKCFGWCVDYWIFVFCLLYPIMCMQVLFDCRTIHDLRSLIVIQGIQLTHRHKLSHQMG